jgi:hypothetical protein
MPACGILCKFTAPRMPTSTWQVISASCEGWISCRFTVPGGACSATCTPTLALPDLSQAALQAGMRMGRWATRSVDSQQRIRASSGAVTFGYRNDFECTYDVEQHVVLGQGASAVVFRCALTPDKCRVAIATHGLVLLCTAAACGRGTVCECKPGGVLHARAAAAQVPSPWLRHARGGEGHSEEHVQDAQHSRA